jgi:hypothetical protein
LVNDADQAARAVQRIGEIDRAACRERVRRHFSVRTMVEAYERVYAKIFELEEAKRT